MTTPTLKSWLARQPYPAIIRAEKADGDEKTVTLGVTRSKFRDAENCLRGCVRCVALDEKGNELRVWEADNAEELRSEKIAAEGDPMSNSVERITAIMADACDRAVQRHSEMVAKGFEQMGQLVQVLSARNAALEKAWQQLFFAQQSDTPQNPSDAMMAALLPAIMGNAMPVPPTSNGAKDAG